MASNLRQFGTEISGNRRRTQEFKPEQRAAICAAVAAGQSPTVVAKAFNCCRATIYNTLNRRANHENFESRPRVGRPKVLTPREERQILRLVRRFPKMSYRALVDLQGATVSKRTLQRILRIQRIRKWISKRRPKLTAEQARERLQFCRFWRGREEELASVSSRL